MKGFVPKACPHGNSMILDGEVRLAVNLVCCITVCDSSYMFRFCLGHYGLCVINTVTCLFLQNNLAVDIGALPVD